MREHSSWDPTAYGRYAGERSRPFADLVAQVRTDDPALVVDLGCGHGPPTLTLAQLWPQARVVGVDSSESMLESARELDHDGQVEWVQSDLREWDPSSLGQAPDVVVTSSTRQWVPGHLDLRDAWVGATYRRYLNRRGGEVDAWETMYLHVVDPEGEDENPVLTWVAATGLRPVIDILTDEDELAAFIDPYSAALADAYPRSSAGVLFPFRRVFAVARRTTESP